MKLCTDCRWLDRTPGRNAYFCNHPKAKIISPVHGHARQDYCHIQRSYRDGSYDTPSGSCCREGYNFEVKE